MSDIGQDIVVPDEMTIRDMIDLKNDTQGRFTFTLDQSGWVSHCRWRNYKKKGGKRVKDANGSWELDEIESKIVVILDA